MGREELTGVLAHELAHVRNRDILIGSIAATMAGAIMFLANMARWSAIFGGGRRDFGRRRGRRGRAGPDATSIVAPLATVLIRMAISRSHEYQADSTGAAFAGSPQGLARALANWGPTLPTGAHGCQPRHGAHVHRQPPRGHEPDEPVFTPTRPSRRIARLRGGRFDGPRETEESSQSLDRQAQARAMWGKLSDKP